MPWIRGYLHRWAWLHVMLIATCIFIPWWIRRPAEYEAYAALRQIPCAVLPGYGHIFVVMKTGSTVLRNRMPIHFETTLKCVPEFMILSDANDSFREHVIHDALSFFDENLRSQFATDFGPQVPRRSRGGSAQGWKLDKYKFLPMMKTALDMKPDAKWFVFIEDDTAVVWSNLLRWLAAYDHKQIYYFGKKTTVADRPFAHGGSGFVLSNAALRHAVEYLEPRVKEYLDLTNEVIYGDISLGWMLADAGIGLTDAWPLFQGESPDRTQYTEEIWCQAVLTQHHMSSQAIASLWMLEQNGLLHAPSESLLHRDVFDALIRPRLRHRLEHWDNGGGYEQSCDTVSQCEALCMTDEKCVQFRYASGQCHLSSQIKLGVPTETKFGITSGWMLQKIDDMHGGLRCNHASL